MEGEEKAKTISKGERCEVTVQGSGGGRRGVVRYVGKPQFAKGWWVGVQYDEPVGKNDGRWVSLSTLLAATWPRSCASSMDALVLCTCHVGLARRRQPCVMGVCPAQGHLPRPVAACPAHCRAHPNGSHPRWPFSVNQRQGCAVLQVSGQVRRFRATGSGGGRRLSGDRRVRL